jgi:hypothetical protein
MEQRRQRCLAHAERNDAGRMGVHDRHDVRPRLVDRRANERASTALPSRLNSMISPAVIRAGAVNARTIRDANSPGRCDPAFAPQGKFAPTDSIGSGNRFGQPKFTTAGPPKIPISTCSHIGNMRRRSESGHKRTLAPQQDTHSADHFIGAREHRRECRTLLFDSNCAALRSANFVNDIT